MLAKTFKGGRTLKGARATIRYLLNERVSDGLAKTLAGNPKITLSLIKQAEKKQKWSWSSGVLSFEEFIQDRAMLEDIINDFETTFFAGLDKDQFNILWVLHEDKGRTELHYIAPRMELSTGLSFNPYFVKRDFAKKDLFQEYINIKHGLSSFRDSRETAPRPPQWRENAKKKDIREAFDEALMPLVKKGIITSREELIYQLNEWGYEINRAGKEYISVTDENGKNHRLKGVIYGEDFTSWSGVEEKIERERRSVANGVPRELEAIRRELNRIIEQQAHTNRGRIHQKLQRMAENRSKEQRQEVPRRLKKVEKATNHSFSNCSCIWLDAGNIKHPTPLTSKGTDSQRKRIGIERGRAEVPADREDTKLENNQRGAVSHDSIGTEAIRRVRSLRSRQKQERRELQKAQRELRRELERVIDRVGFNISRQLDEAHRHRGQRSRELNSVLEDAFAAAKPNYTAIEQATAERRTRREAERGLAAIFEWASNGIQFIKSEFDKRAERIVEIFRGTIVKKQVVVSKKKRQKAAMKYNRWGNSMKM